MTSYDSHLIWAPLENSRCAGALTLFNKRIMQSVLADKSLLDRIVSLAGGPIWLHGLRGSCRLAGRMVQPERRKFADEERMLSEGARSGDIGLCKYAINIGACRFFNMAKKAAKYGRFGTFMLAIGQRSFGSGSGKLYCMTMLICPAVAGGDMDIIRTVAAYFRDNGQCSDHYCLYFSNILYAGWDSLHMEAAYSMLNAIRPYLYHDSYDRPDDTYDRRVKFPLLMYGYTGEKKYFHAAIAFFSPLGCKEKMHILHGAVRSGNIDRVMKVLHYMRDCSLDDVVMNSSFVFRMPVSLTGSRRALLAQALCYAAEYNNLVLCKALAEQIPSDISVTALDCAIGACNIDASLFLSMVNGSFPLELFCRWKGKNGLMGCRIGASFGIIRPGGMLSTASKEGGSRTCRLAMSLGAKNLFGCFYNGFCRGSFTICKWTIAEGCRRFALLVRRGAVPANIRRLFGFKSPAAFRAAAAHWGKHPGVPMICVVLGVRRRRIARMTESMMMEISRFSEEGLKYRDKLLSLLEAFTQDCRFVCESGSGRLVGIRPI